MVILFLDIDGVLNSAKFFAATEEARSAAAPIEVNPLSKNAYRRNKRRAKAESEEEILARLDASLAEDVLADAYTDADVTAALRAAGADPEAVGRRGAALAAELLEKRRLAWQDKARKKIERTQPVFAPRVDYSGIGKQDWSIWMLDPVSIARLNEIVRRTGAKVVISSSWRIGGGHEPVAAILGRAGFVGEVIDATPVTIALAPGIEHERGHEIAAWMSERQIDRFVILDDCDDMAHLRSRLVQTSWSEGLLDEHVERTVTLLGGTL